MKKFLSIFFTVLGVVFFLILLFVAYLFIFDPFNIKPFIFDDKSIQPKTINTNESNSSTDSTDTNVESPDSATEIDKAPNLSPVQEKALETVGIDPAAIPQSFTAEQLTCFEAALGKARVEEIKAGDTPSAAEFFKAKACI